MIIEKLNKFIPAVIFVALLLTPLKSVHADYIVSQPVGQPFNQLMVTKQVQNPSNGTLQKNLLISDTHILPDQEVLFQIIVKNSGSNILNNVLVTDHLPNYLDFVSANYLNSTTPIGSFDKNSRLFTLSIDLLNPGETRTIMLHAKVQPAKFLPSDMVTCPTNLVEVRSGQLVNQDTSSFCIETRILGVSTTQLPKTGPGETTYILAMSFIALLFAGYFFKKSTLIEGR